MLDVMIGSSSGKVTLLGWYFDKKNRVELVLNNTSDKIQLKQIVNGSKMGSDNVSVQGGGVVQNRLYHMHLRYDRSDEKFKATVKDTVTLTTLTIEINATGIPIGVPGFRVGPGNTGHFSNIAVWYFGEATCTSECSCSEQIAFVPAEIGEEFTSNKGSNPSITIDNLSVEEGTEGYYYALVKIRATPAPLTRIRVDVSTSNGTAVAGTDYLTKSGTIRIQEGQSVRVIKIPIIGDYTIESNETFNVNLSNATGGATITDSQATVTLIDNDTPEADEGTDNEFAVDCPSQFSVLKDGTRTMSCTVTLYDPLDINTDIAWNCNNSSSIQCTFQGVGTDQLNVLIDPGTSTLVGDIANFTIAGVIDSVSRTDTLTLRVVDFQHTCPDPITVVKGSFTDSSCSVGQSSNWTDTSLQVTWSCSGLPSGASCVFTPNPWNVGSGSSVNLRIQTTTGTPSGNYNITVTGTSGLHVRTDPVLLKVVTQTTYTFYPIGDSFLKDNGQNENEGLTTHLRLQHPDRSSHVVLKFSQSSITSTIGTKVIVSANLKLYIETNFNNWGASGASVDAHRMTASWEEYISGSPAQGVTWSCPIDTNLGNANPNCTTQWSGGSYSSTILNTQVHQNNQTGWKTFNITSDLQAIQGGSTHYGWLVRKRNSTDQGSVDYTSIQGSASFKPRLEVTVND